MRHEIVSIHGQREEIMQGNRTRSTNNLGKLLPQSTAKDNCRLNNTFGIQWVFPENKKNHSSTSANKLQKE